MANGVLMEGDLQIPLLHFCQDNGTNVINGNGTIRGGQNSDETILVNGKGQTLTINSKDIRSKAESQVSLLQLLQSGMESW